MGFDTIPLYRLGNQSSWRSHNLFTITGWRGVGWMELLRQCEVGGPTCLQWGTFPRGRGRSEAPECQRATQCPRRIHVSRALNTGEPLGRSPVSSLAARPQQGRDRRDEPGASKLHAPDYPVARSGGQQPGSEETSRAATDLRAPRFWGLPCWADSPHPPSP